MDRLISTNNKLIMFSLSVLTLLFVIFIFFNHVKPRFHVKDLLQNEIREKSTQRNSLAIKSNILQCFGIFSQM